MRTTEEAFAVLEAEREQLLIDLHKANDRIKVLEGADNDLIVAHVTFNPGGKPCPTCGFAFSRYIPTEGILPKDQWQTMETAPKGESVLLFTAKRTIHQGVWLPHVFGGTAGSWWQGGHQIGSVTHWHPLPLPPKEPT